VTTIPLYCTLFAATTLYAVVLSRFPKRDPDWTWFTVALGIAICLTAPALDRRQNGPLTSELYEWRVWQAFIIGGIPIIAWQVGRSIHAWYSWIQRVLSRVYGNTTDHATSVARKRGKQSEADD
jgi:hypothetical protein